MVDQHRRESVRERVLVVDGQRHLVQQRQLVQIDLRRRHGDALEWTRGLKPLGENLDHLSDVIERHRRKQFPVNLSHSV